MGKDKDGNLRCQPILSRIISLFAEQNDLQYAVPGGLIGAFTKPWTFCKQCIISLKISGVGTKIDPTLCRADRLVGHVLGAVGALPNIYIDLEISYFLLRRLLGVRTEGDKKGAKVVSKLSWMKHKVFNRLISGSKTGEERNSDDQHWFVVVRRSRLCCEGRFGEDLAS